MWAKSKLQKHKRDRSRRNKSSKRSGAKSKLWMPKQGCPVKIEAPKGLRANRNRKSIAQVVLDKTPGPHKVAGKMQRLRTYLHAAHR
jgi:hypothetical protein